MPVRNARANKRILMYLENVKHDLMSAKCNLKNIVMIEVHRMPLNPAVRKATKEKSHDPA